MVTEEELKNITADSIVDARGSACPGPLLEAKKALGKIDSGKILEVHSSDEGTKRDIPKFCDKKGHEFLGTVEEPGYFKIFLKKN